MEVFHGLLRFGVHFNGGWAPKHYERFYGSKSNGPGITTFWFSTLTHRHLHLYNPALTNWDITFIRMAADGCMTSDTMRTSQPASNRILQFRRPTITQGDKPLTSLGMHIVARWHDLWAIPLGNRTCSASTGR